MSSPPAGIPEADWLATPASVRTLILIQQQEIQALRQENDELRSQLTSLATELVSLRERIGRSSRNSSKPPVRRQQKLVRRRHENWSTPWSNPPRP